MLRIGVGYWLSLHPAARRQLTTWDRRARGIPDPVLRRHAMGKLTAERLNPEAAALFAILAPSHTRGKLVRLIVAYQLLYDYLDAVNEQPGCTSLENGLRLHDALVDAALLSARRRDYYACNANRHDGDYAVALVDACSRTLASLPAASMFAPVLERVARRCGEAQAHNHALISEGTDGVINWCATQQLGDGYHWWELTAAGISCLVAHTLFAHAAQADARDDEARVLADGYFPAVCAISALLDSLADHDIDAGTTNHSFTAHYRTSTHAARRLVAIASEAAAGVAVLPQRHRHAVILAGILGYYLSSPTVQGDFAGSVACRLVAAVDLHTRCMRIVIGVWRTVSAAECSTG